MSPSASPAIPLAERLRPRTLREVIGQAHLLGPGMPLRRALDAGRLHSMVLWGPPGVGKTTLGRLAAQAFACEFIALSGVMGNTQEIRAALTQAATSHANSIHTLLFVDEIHRFARRQQEELLPALQAGHITLMGATTENPSFTMSRQLLARLQVYVLKPLAETDLATLLTRAQDTLGAPRLSPAAASSLLTRADGARRLLNLVEQCHIAARATGIGEIDATFAGNVVSPAARRFDKGGENFYDQISALHKSVRGSHPDAALYWLCRMLDGGTNLRYLARRIIAMAWDDIGLADPQAMRIANAAAECCEHEDRMDGELALAQAVLYLAAAPKSNAGTLAYGSARALAGEDAERPVPLRLRKGSPAELLWVDCLPDGMEDPEWYQPVPRGLEINIAQKMARLRRGQDV